MDAGVRIAVGIAIIFLFAGIASGRIKFLWMLIFAGRPDDERFEYFKHNHVWAARNVMAQRKLFQWSLPGLLHALTFWGFLVVQIMLLESIGELFDHDFQIPIVGDHAWLGFMEDLFIVLVAAALFGFAAIRVARSPKRLQRASRFYESHMGPAYLILFMILLVIATNLGIRAPRAALGTLPYGDAAFLSHWVGTEFLGTISERSLLWMQDGFVLGHIAVVFAFLVLVVNSKHLHIFTSPLNVAFGRHPLALGRLRPVEIDLENMTEETSIGAGKIEDFTWKQYLDMYTCTECGRCQSVCPAWNTDKPLNPKLLIMNLRDHLFEKAPVVLGQKKPEELPEVTGKSLVPDVISDEVLWDCVTCGACVYECPVDIEHVDAIMDMRRYQVMMESRFPQEAGVMLRNLENSGNPWGAPDQQRLDWTKGMEDRVVVVDGEMPPDAEYLYWVGCAGAFDDRAKKTVAAFAQLMNEAGVSFAILGPQERCTGDPARRMGNEYLFQEIAKQNIQTLDGKGVRKIVVSCPHCFNTMANEYPDFGGRYEVVHHTQLLARLVKEGRLTPQAHEVRVTYHDPCYLARHNGVIEPPRKVLESVPGLESTEMHRCKAGTFCCGAGGARLWMEETRGRRINIERIDEALATNPDAVSVACPYCMIMLDDAVKDKVAKGEASEHVQVLDVAQILARSVGLNGRGRASATVGAHASTEDGPAAEGPATSRGPAGGEPGSSPAP